MNMPTTASDSLIAMTKIITPAKVGLFSIQSNSGCSRLRSMTAHYSGRQLLNFLKNASAGTATKRKVFAAISNEGVELAMIVGENGGVNRVGGQAG